MNEYPNSPDGNILPKPSHTDPELMELCKEVYEKTGWDKTEHVRFPDDFPLYTSDFLLEKLPAVVLSHTKGFSYRASSRLIKDRFTADTPLKSLLKLVIALHESEETK